jgi:hypothetical protein
MNSSSQPSGSVDAAHVLRRVRVVRQRWAQCERLELYELRHARAAQPIERGLPPHFVANQLGHTDDGALVLRLYGHRLRARTARSNPLVQKPAGYRGGCWIAVGTSSAGNGRAKRKPWAWSQPSSRKRAS